METALELAPQVKALAIAQQVEAAMGAAAELAEQADAPSTRRAYAADSRAWVGFAEAIGFDLEAADDEGLAQFACLWIGDLTENGAAPSSVARYAAGVTRSYRDAGKHSPFDHPIAKKVLKGVRRQNRQRGCVGAPAFPIGLVERGLNGTRARTRVRDRAVFLVGFATGARRSELASITRDDIRESDQGFTIELRVTKNGEARTVGVPARHFSALCPAAALRAHLAEIDGDEVFPSVDTINRIVKAVAVAAKVANPDSYSAHSLRATFLTLAAKAGVSLAESMQVTGHRTADVAAGYYREADALANQATDAVADALERVAGKA